MICLGFFLKLNSFQSDNPIMKSKEVEGEDAISTGKAEEA